jgi:hypothetical protein
VFFQPQDGQSHRYTTGLNRTSQLSQGIMRQHSERMNGVAHQVWFEASETSEK